MENFWESLTQSLNYIAGIRPMDVVDILLVAALIYFVIGLIRRTGTVKVFQGILILLLALWLSDELQLNVVNFILRNTVELGFLALVVIFQPELRRFLEKLGTGGPLSSMFGGNNFQSTETAIAQTALACTEFSSSKTGALIIFERDNRLDDQVRTGTVVDADTTAELLKNIFYPKAPLHDGAVVIREGRILAAGCVLPLSGNANLSKDLGMRHRAGIGMSESSDAVVVIVSEETGSIPVAIDGMLKRHLARDTFEMLLRNELLTEESETPARRPFWKRGKEKSHD